MVAKYEEVRTLLMQMGSQKGVDPNQPNRRTEECWTIGTPLAHAITNHGQTPAARLQMVKALLAAGADVGAKVTAPALRGKGTKTWTILEYALERAAFSLRVGPSFAADSQRRAKRELESYRQTLPLLLAAGATTTPWAKKILAKLGVGKTERQTSAPKLDPAWVKKARALLLKKKGRDGVYEICEKYLAHPTAISSAEWPKLVVEIIDSSQTFEAVAEEVYGEAVSFLDDEGDLCQGWENYVLIDLVLELLAREPAVQNAEWAAVVGHALKSRERYHATGYVETEVEALFAQPWVKRHPDYKKLKALEAATR